MRLNSTVLSLSVTAVSSSASVMHAPSFEHSFVKFRDIRVFRSFSPFLAAFSPHASFGVSRCHFAKSLQSVIHISRVSKNFSKFGTSLREKPDEDLEILLCTFTEVSSRKNGGAIFLKNYRYSIYLTRCGFSLCATHQSGGAIYVVGYQFLSNRCCFYGCVGLISEQAVYCNVRRYAKDDAADNTFNLSFISQCSPRQSKGGKRAVYLSGGMQIFMTNNFSNNHVNEEAAGAITSYPTIFTLKFCDFCRSSGTNIMWMHLLEETFQLSYCNIYNNSLPGNISSIVVVEQSRAILARLIFFQNTALHYMEGTYSVLLQECTFDIKQFAGMFGDLRVSEKGTKYYTKIQKYKLKFAPTWDCWSLGSPSPKQPGILSQLLFIQDSSTAAVMLVFVLIIALIAIVAFIMMRNTTTEDIENLQPIVIQN